MRSDGTVTGQRYRITLDADGRVHKLSWAFLTAPAPREEGTRIVDEDVAPCDRPATTATVRQLGIDSEGRVVRSRAMFTLACPSGAPRRRPVCSLVC